VFLFFIFLPLGDSLNKGGM